MKTIHFNTGRKYTANGQRISATLHDDGQVTFYDHDRGIYGEFALGDRPFNAAYVMSAYDHGGYGRGALPAADAMMVGGVNSEWKEGGR